MNGWTAVLFAADVVGVVLAIVVMVRRGEADGMRIACVLITGALIADVAFHVRYLGLVLAVIFVVLSMVPVLTATLSMTLLANAGPTKHARRSAVMPIVLPAMAVLFCVDLWGSPRHLSVAELDAAQFGVKVELHLTNVQALASTGTPTIHDATFPLPGGGASAVPVEQYVLDGRLLTLLVEHDMMCQPAVVLFHSAAGTLEVVVAAQTLLTRTSGQIDPIRIDATCQPLLARNAVHAVVDISLPESVTVSAVSDVGAYGATVHTAKRVPATP